MATSLDSSILPAARSVAAEARILLIDADRDSRASHRRALRKGGFAVDAANNDRAATSSLGRRKPDLVLLRLARAHQWDPSGLEELHTHPDARDIPIVILSEGFDAAAVVSALDRGARDVWAGPITGDELVARIRAQLRTTREIHRLREQVCIDELTGILNRRGILNVLERETNRLSRDGTPLGILLIDVDDFKLVNDTYGHRTGDQVLRDIGRVLRESVRATDAAGRLGGDEFLVVLAGVSEAQAQRVARRIRRDIESITVPPAGRCVRVSIGVAVTRAKSASSHMLLDDADQSMYRAKRTGGDMDRPSAKA